MQLRLSEPDVLGTGYNIRHADDGSGRLVIGEVLSSASDVLHSLMNAGLWPTFIFHLFIIESYTKYKIDINRKWKEKKAAHTTWIQSSTHSRERTNNIVTCIPDRQS